MLRFLKMFEIYFQLRANACCIFIARSGCIEITLDVMRQKRKILPGEQPGNLLPPLIKHPLETGQRMLRLGLLDIFALAQRFKFVRSEVVLPVRLLPAQRLLQLERAPAKGLIADVGGGLCRGILIISHLFSFKVET